MVRLVLWSIHNPAQNLISCKLSKLIFHYPSACLAHFARICLLFFSLSTQCSFLLLLGLPGTRRSFHGQPVCLGIPEATLPTAAHVPHCPAYLLGTSAGLTAEYKSTLGGGAASKLSAPDSLAVPRTILSPTCGKYHIVSTLRLNNFNGPLCITSWFPQSQDMTHLKINISRFYPQIKKYRKTHCTKDR